MAVDDLTESHRLLVAVKTANRRGATQKFYLNKGGSMSIGRAPVNDIVIESPGVSREHLKIAWTDGAPVISDLNSTNGTILNKVKIEQPTELKPGDVVSLSDTSISFHLPENNISDELDKLPPLQSLGITQPSGSDFRTVLNNDSSGIADLENLSTQVREREELEEHNHPDVVGSLVKYFAIGIPVGIALAFILIKLL